ncbi:MAG TPA: helix-turn-helix transcriptional regulator [Jiangellaceae bacterium]
MTAQLITGVASDLAGRLRELRESRFSGVRITQRALGRALGSNKPLSAPLISSWEKGAATPPERWIAAYATFFATTRSVDGGSFRLLRDDELTEAERSERAALERELLSLRSRVLSSESSPDYASALRGAWHFADGHQISIVCAEIPPESRNLDATPTHPTLPYGELYSYNSIDALFELHGHIRAANPHSEVRVFRADDLQPDDLASHLVILGGPDWNNLARRIPELVPDFPVRQCSAGADPRNAYFEVPTGDGVAKHRAVLSDGDELIWDVGLFLRAPNPANRKRTLTVCAAMYSVGDWAVVRSLTDSNFRDRNADYLANRFDGSNAFSIVMRILVLNGHEAVTPDWTVPVNRLYEWPEAPTS